MYVWISYTRRFRFLQHAFLSLKMEFQAKWNQYNKSIEQKSKGFPSTALQSIVCSDIEDGWILTEFWICKNLVAKNGPALYM